MKFLLITREFPPNVLGGVSYHSYYLARNLVDLGHEVKLLTSKGEGHKEDTSAFDFTGINIERIGYRKLPGPRYWFNRAVISHLKEENYPDVDIIHAHEFIDFSSLELDKKVILKIHFNLAKKKEFNNLNNVPRFLKPLARTLADRTIWKKERKLEKKALESSDSRIYISDLSKKVYKEEYGFEDKNCKIIYNGVDTSKFNLKSENPAEDYLLFLGGSDKRKGIQELISSYKDLEDPINIKIIGEFEDNRLKEEAGEIQNMEVLGRVDQDELVGLYQDAKALIHPAKYEPFGNVVLESLSCGTPVIVSNEHYCGAAEILDGEVSKKIKPTVDSIKQAIKESEEWEVDPKKCRDVATDHTWEKIAKETVRYAN